MICDKCKKFFLAGNRPDGIPNGVKMVLQGGNSITLCADCVINLGSMDDEQKAHFFDDLPVEGKEKPQ